VAEAFEAFVGPAAAAAAEEEDAAAEVGLVADAGVRAGASEAPGARSVRNGERAIRTILPFPK
jgi:hypothetical protein